jgi:hypothetical protein
MEHWIPWLGRTLNSAHVARGEILVDRPDEEMEQQPEPGGVS